MNTIRLMIIRFHLHSQVVNRRIAMASILSTDRQRPLSIVSWPFHPDLPKEVSRGESYRSVRRPYALVATACSKIPTIAVFLVQMSTMYAKTASGKAAGVIRSIHSSPSVRQRHNFLQSRRLLFQQTIHLKAATALFQHAHLNAQPSLIAMAVVPKRLKDTTIAVIA